MGKHRTAQQDAIFVAFMERHPIIAKNYYKGDKLASEAAWKRLSKELNSVGPPVKESGEWKRVWKDWKNCIRKKIANNRLEPNATGKSSLYQDTLTPLEDAVATISDLYEMADVIVESQPKTKVRDERNSSVSLQDIKTDRSEDTFENEDGEQEAEEDEDDDDESNESISIQNGVKVEQQMKHHSTAKKRSYNMMYPELVYSDSENVDESILNIRKNSNIQNIDIISKLHEMMELQTTANEKIEQLLSKVHHQAEELTSLKLDVAAIKVKACGDIPRMNEILPKPLTSMEEITHFENILNDQKVYNNFISELLLSGEKSYEKFIRKSWRQILSDDVAKLCSWRGKDCKKCVKDMNITLALRAAFKQKFALDDSDFDKITQQFFQYAKDRQSKGKKYKSKKFKDSTTSI